MTTLDQIDYEQSYDFNPYAPAMPKADELMSSKEIEKFAKTIKGYKWLDTEEKVSSYLADSVIEMDINQAMARQMLEALNIEACDWFKHVVGDDKSGAA